MLICGLDYETTGLDPEVHSIIEVGMVIWDTDLHAPVKVMGYMVSNPDAVWDPEVINLYPQSKELCLKYGYPDEKAIKQHLLWYQQCDYACAHNGRHFDRKFLRTWADKYGYDWQPQKLWIDTNSDIELPHPNQMSRKLVYMAADHDFLNPFPHRAVFDVMTMFKVLDQYPFERVLELAKSPDIEIAALVEYEDRELAKARGYRWQPEPRKLWTMNIKEMFLEREKAEAGFPIKVLGRSEE